MGFQELELQMNEMCDLLDLSAQGIRLYEKHDAIHSFKYQGNGYRYYYFEDIAPAIQLRCMRKLGIPLASCTRGQSGQTQDALEASLADCRQRIEENIRYEQALLRASQELSRGLSLALTRRSTFDFCDRPAMYHLLCERNGSFLADADSRRLIKNWSHHLPFVRFCPMMQAEGLGHDSVAQLGLSFRGENSFAPQLDHPLVRRLPQIPCVGGVVFSGRGTTDYYSVVEPGLRFLQQHSLELAGDILTELIAADLAVQDDVISCYYAWYPFREMDTAP